MPLLDIVRRLASRRLHGMGGRAAGKYGLTAASVQGQNAHEIEISLFGGFRLFGNHVASDVITNVEFLTEPTEMSRLLAELAGVPIVALSDL
jgi:hypothetical protein